MRRPPSEPVRVPHRYLDGQPLATCVDHGLRPFHGTAPADCEVLGCWVLPPFQRPPVWAQAQQIRFLESLWLGLPVSVYVVNRAPKVSFTRFDSWLIDGQQRWRAIYAYVADAFPVLGYRYSELNRTERTVFELLSFPCIQIGIDDECRLLELYNRLAYGGTPHA